MGHSKTTILNLVVLFFLATYFFNIGFNGAYAQDYPEDCGPNEPCEDKGHCCVYIRRNYGDTCQPLATNGSRCSKQKSKNAVYTDLCPCQPGYECKAKGPQGSREKCHPKKK